MGRGDGKKLADQMSEIEADLVRAVSIDPQTIQDEYVHLPADIALYNERLARSTRLYLFAEIERKAVHGKVYLRRAEELITIEPDPKGNPKKKWPSVDRIEAAVNSDPEYINAREEEAMYDAERLRFRGIVDSLSAKRDMLVSLGAHLRLEMANDPVIRERMGSLVG